MTYIHIFNVQAYPDNPLMAQYTVKTKVQYAKSDMT